MAKTPPNTPQCAHTAARQNKQNGRILDSPEHRHPPPPHLPVHPQIAPLHSHNIHMPPVQPPPKNSIVVDDPFGPPVPVHFNGQQYLNLSQDLVQQMQDVAAFPQPQAQGHGRGQARGQQPPVSVEMHLLKNFRN